MAQAVQRRDVLGQAGGPGDGADPAAEPERRPGLAGGQGENEIEAAPVGGAAGQLFLVLPRPQPGKLIG
jgi:hypothetical protein